MPPILWNGLPLIRNGQPAVSLNCCCGEQDCCTLLFTPEGRTYEVQISGYSFPGGGFGENGTWAVSVDSSQATGCLHFLCSVCFAEESSSIIIRLTWLADENKWRVIQSDESTVYYWESIEITCSEAYGQTITLSPRSDLGAGSPPGTGTVTVRPLGVV